KRNGLHSDDNSFLTADSQQRLWAGTDDGVDVYERGSWRHYDHTDGLLWDDCIGQASYVDRDGSMWIGTSQGLSHARLAPKSSTASAPVVITGARLGAESFTAGASPVVPYRSHSLLMGFSALTFRNEQRVRFRYRLAGLHEDWIETAERKADYLGIPPGSYTFEVEVKSENGWSAAPA